MSGLAKLLKNLGFFVAGSDARMSRETQELESMGISVHMGHEMNHIHNHDLVIYSSAVTQSNPERREALLRSVPIFHRSDLLAMLMNQAISIGIAGTHGKTTTTAFASFIFNRAGIKPSCLVGGRMINFNSNVLVGDSHLFLAEVDESDRTHLKYQPDYAVVTNLEEDHLDTYQNFENLKQSFKEYISNIKSTGHLIYCGHDEQLREISDCAGKRISYGLSKQFDFGAEEIQMHGFSSQYKLFEKGKPIQKVQLSVPGKHNVLNSLAAIAVAKSFGLSYKSFIDSTAQFRGVGRRLEIKLQTEKLTVIDDYAHHPTEIEASLQAIRTLGKHTTVVFQPHRYSRTRYLQESFSKSFHQADRVILTDIYSAGEENLDGVDVRDLYGLLKEKHPNVSLVSKKQIVEQLISEESTEGVVAFLGAGDITEVASEFAARFNHTN